jgi:rhamnosyltransferase
MTVALFILTHNAANFIDRQVAMLRAQTTQPDFILFVDSSSSDYTADRIINYGYQHHTIPILEFNHGGTRRLATDLIDADIYIFMTQDAILAEPASLKNLLAGFRDDKDKIGCVYGRQLPNKDASIFAEHSRLFNYSATSKVKSLADRDDLGIKTCFNSDSFSAYRRDALLEIGGFPQHIAFGEDVYVAAKMLMNNWKVAYQADARVHHSHNYSPIEEFKRYFSIGAFHAANQWILDNFSSPNGEGIKYAKSEILYCWDRKRYLAVLGSALRSATKYVAYKLGKIYQKLNPSNQSADVTRTQNK